LPALLSGLLAFFAYYIGSTAYCAVFCLIYTRLTLHDEFDLIVRLHNASAGLAFGAAGESGAHSGGFGGRGGGE